MKGSIIAAALLFIPGAFFALQACANFQDRPVLLQPVASGGTEQVATIPVGDSFENSLKPGLSREKVFRLFESPNGGNGHWEKKSMGSRSTGAGKEEVYVYSWVGPPNIASGPVPPMVRIVFLDGSLLDHETFGLPKASG